MRLSDSKTAIEEVTKKPSSVLLDNCQMIKNEVTEQGDPHLMRLESLENKKNEATEQFHPDSVDIEDSEMIKSEVRFVIFWTSPAKIQPSKVSTMYSDNSLAQLFQYVFAVGQFSWKHFPVHECLAIR